MARVKLVGSCPVAGRRIVVASFWVRSRALVWGQRQIDRRLRILGHIVPPFIVISISLLSHPITIHMANNKKEKFKSRPPRTFVTVFVFLFAVVFSEKSGVGFKLRQAFERGTC